MDQERIDAGPARGAERFAQNRMRLVEVDVAHHFEITVEIAIADGRDDNVADLAMVHAGNMLRGLGRHVETSIRWEESSNESGADGFQELVDTICDQVRRLDRHVMSSADLDIT